jgi:hypothetical protein
VGGGGVWLVKNTSIIVLKIRKSKSLSLDGAAIVNFIHRIELNRIYVFTFKPL